jgi:hypothetical protein
VKHRRFFVDEVTASGHVLPPLGGNLLVVRRAESPDLDWELVVQTRQPVRVDQAPYRLEISGPEGSFRGSAILVRSDGRSHVFRGAGDLDGFAEIDFHD